ncbi:SH2 domain-containing protein A-like [Punica granatum]|uniref:SH2 domain-containing protein A-like n=1 Tax=Punica granatum TaxID=22663 RepID=A0A6P8C1L2_PUNGR|nr:SH2 domain-containing protein A-like [Punica granatum]
MGKNENAMEIGNYCLLKDFRLEVEARGEQGEGSFSFCFWVYLLSSTPFPSTLIRQVGSDMMDSAPLLVLNEKKRLMLFPLLPSQDDEAPDPNNLTLWNNIPHASLESDFPFGKWTRIGCEVSNGFLRLYVDGELVEEKTLASSETQTSNFSGLRRIILIGSNNNESGLSGYLYSPKDFLSASSIKGQYKDSPIYLIVDNSSAVDIEKGSDGVWNIVGGKASCRRNFSLDVVLLDALGETVDKEIEVVASLIYANNGTPVEKTSDGEAPLLTSYDGIDFDSCDRPSKLLQGRASLRLKISQLSSKCDNKLFQIKFNVPKAGKYPFLEALSYPIRCISRNRNVRTSSVIIWKRPASGFLSVCGSQSSRVNFGLPDLPRSTVREAKPSPLSKRVRLANYTFEQPDDECNSHVQTAIQAKNFSTTNSKMPQEESEAGEKSPSDSESTREGNSCYRNSRTGNSISDLAIFNYCLGGSTERTLLLKDITSSASNEEILEFADQVALYSGCSHHRNQIRIAKRLIEEGARFWNSISQDNQHVNWESVVFEIEEQFMKISCCNTRSLSQQDFEILRKVAGCRDCMTKENFEKMWRWLYPVAFALSRSALREMWSSKSPTWIEGFVTKEEAEASLQGPGGSQKPGTFILRFPTSRSWPHPDAGSIVVTYVGADYSLHHRLLSLDHIYCNGEMNMTPLPEMLLAEPELSQLGRISTRSR